VVLGGKLHILRDVNFEWLQNQLNLFLLSLIHLLQLAFAISKCSLFQGTGRGQIGTHGVDIVGLLASNLFIGLDVSFRVIRFLFITLVTRLVHLFCHVAR